MINYVSSMYKLSDSNIIHEVIIVFLPTIPIGDLCFQNKINQHGKKFISRHNCNNKTRLELI